MTATLKSALIGAVAAPLALIVAGAAPAAAGECPAAQMKSGVRKTGEMAPIDVTDTELQSIDLSKEIDGLEGRRLRYRRLVVGPGGVVPWHDHTDRPALIMVVDGQITEFRSDCGVGITHKAGDISKEVAGIMHWWKNESDKPATLYAADIKNDAAP
jgi:quercetin dioxygenase-like cupin family protein